MLLIQPTEEMSKRIREELNENVDTREKDLEHIKDWLAKQAHLPKFDGKLKTWIELECNSKKTFYNPISITNQNESCVFFIEKARSNVIANENWLTNIIRHCIPLKTYNSSSYSSVKNISLEKMSNYYFIL